MIEVRPGQNFLSMFEDAESHSSISLLRNQLGGVVGRELVEEEEVGGGGGIAEELDALADERGDGEYFFWRSLKAGLREEGLDAAAELLDGQGADMLGVEPDGLRVERVFLGEVDHGVGAVDAFESEGGGESRRE